MSRNEQINDYWKIFRKWNNEDRFLYLLLLNSEKDVFQLIFRKNFNVGVYWSLEFFLDLLSFILGKHWKWTWYGISTKKTLWCVTNMLQLQPEFLVRSFSKEHLNRSWEDRDHFRILFQNLDSSQVRVAPMFHLKVDRATSLFFFWEALAASQALSFYCFVFFCLRWVTWHKCRKTLISTSRSSNSYFATITSLKSSIKGLRYTSPHSKYSTKCWISILESQSWYSEKSKEGYESKLSSWFLPLKF